MMNGISLESNCFKCQLKRRVLYVINLLRNNAYNELHFLNCINNLFFREVIMKEVGWKI